MPTLVAGLHLLPRRDLYSFTPILRGVEVSESLIPPEHQILLGQIFSWLGISTDSQLPFLL